MADNVAITAGSGTSIATDDVSGAHYQKMKLYDGTADSSNAAIVDASGNLQVEVTNTGITGTAGTPNSGVLSVQGITSMTPVQAQLVAGTAAIGKLAANDGVDIGNVDVASLPSIPAGTNAIGKLAANSGVDIGDVDVTSLPAGVIAGMSSLPAGTNAIGKLAANSGVDIGDVDVLSLPALTVDKGIQWSHISAYYSSAQTSVDIVALSGTTKFYVGRIMVSSHYAASQSGRTTVQVYFGTGAVSDSAKHVARATFITVPGTSLESYPGLVIGNGAAPFIISAAGDAMKITTTTSGTHCGISVHIDYIRV